MKWKAECIGSEGYQVRYNHEGLTVTQFPKEERYPVVERMGGSFEKQKGNANLIAAAPDMYEALKAIETQLWAECCKLSKDNSILYADFEKRYQNVRKAIAKAEGK